MLDYFALGLLIFVALVLFYGVIAIHDIPYEIAKSRQHPQQDAIHVTGWISLFTLHTIWPFLWIWATLYRPDRGWGFVGDKEDKLIIPKLIITTEALQERLNNVEAQNTQTKTLSEQLQALSEKVNALETQAQTNKNDKEDKS